MSTLITPEIIGDPSCPILKRWTMLPPLWGKKAHSVRHGGWCPDWLPKLLLHHFLPNADERHSHDHPRAFWTFVFLGGYDDMVSCSNEVCENGQVRSGGFTHIEGVERSVCIYSALYECPNCGGAGVVLGERMRAPALRYRPATHTHRTRVHADGSWSIVLMGPMVREWGFHLGTGRWMNWEEYKDKFGHGMRCS